MEKYVFHRFYGSIDAFSINFTLLDTNNIAKRHHASKAQWLTAVIQAT
jgi:hypothetical protein